MNDFGFGKETEILTKEGWKLISDIVVGDECVSYSIDKGCLELDTVIDITKNHNTEVIKLYHKLAEFNCGKDQLWYGWKRMWAKKGCKREKYFHKFTIPEITQEFNILCSAKYSGGNSTVTPQEAAFIGWLLSDGYYRWSEDTKRTSSSFGNKRGVTGMIAQAQHKFYREVEQVITSVGLPYSLHEDNTGVKTSPVNKYHFHCGEFRSFMDRVVGERLPKSEINWCKHILSYTEDSIYEFLYNFWLADGDTKRDNFGGTKTTIVQNAGTVADSVMLAMFLQGKRVSSGFKSPNDHKCLTLRMLKNGHITMQEVNTESVGLHDTFDILTNNGTYVIKQGSNLSITCSSSFNLKDRTND